MTMEIVGKDGAPLNPKKPELKREQKREAKKYAKNLIDKSDEFVAFYFKNETENSSAQTTFIKMGSYQHLVATILDQFMKNGEVGNLISHVIGQIQKTNPEIINQIIELSKTEENE